MAIIGYARVSTVGQSLTVQRDKLKAEGVERLFEEKRSGLDRGRPALNECLAYLRQGDTLVVTRIDRLARSAEDLLGIVRELQANQVALRVIDQQVNTEGAAGRAFLGILAVFAEFETDIRRERQQDGIARAKADGIRFGRKRLLTEETVRAIKEMRGEGETIPRIMKATGLSKASVYRALGEGMKK